MVLALDRIDLGLGILLRDSWREIDRFIRVMHHVTWRRPDMRWHAWRLLAECMIRNPRAVRTAVAMVVFYLYLAPLTRYVTDHVEQKIVELDAAPPAPERARLPIAATAA
jgi:hypothetical protein